MSEPVPLNYQSAQRRAPEPLEEAVEKAVVDLLAFTLRAYDCFPSVNVTRADVETDLELPAIVVRAARLRESIPTGDVYEVQVAISAMTLMDQDDDVSEQLPTEVADEIWRAVVAVIEDPNLLTTLRVSRETLTWHGLTRPGGMEFSRQERHSVRTFRFSVHVSRRA